MTPPPPITELPRQPREDGRAAVDARAALAARAMRPVVADHARRHAPGLRDRTGQRDRPGATAWLHGVPAR
jgi:hypothetical protein